MEVGKKKPFSLETWRDLKDWMSGLVRNMGEVSIYIRLGLVIYT